MITYFSWWYYTELIYLWNSSIILTKRVYFTFSIPNLLGTLFYPWKRDALYVENPSLEERFQIWIGNMVSRFIGAIVRTITIVSGLFCTIITFMIVVIFILIWIFMPGIIIFLFIHGITNLNG